MPRPENPVTGNGPAAELARALRRLRVRAGNLDYRTLAREARYSSTTLADAASGATRPSWEVARAFARACGAGPADLGEIDALWAAADKAHKAARSREVRARRRLRAVRGNAELRAAPRQGPRGKKPDPGQPRPDASGTAGQFVRQLRALRAWAGQPGYKAISVRAGIGLPRSTMYDALDPKRVTLPSLDAVQLIVAGCAPESLEEWTFAWRFIKMREVGPPLADSSQDPVPELAAYRSRIRSSGQGA